MKVLKIINFVFFITLLLFTFTTHEVQALPNPASVSCNEKGFKSEIKEAPIFKDQYAVCIFNDGSQCEEWDYYKGLCNIGDCEKVIGVYDCNQPYNPEVCQNLDFKLLKNKLEGKSLIIRNEKDYEGVKWSDDKHNGKWYKSWCCEFKTECSKKTVSIKSPVNKNNPIDSLVFLFRYIWGLIKNIFNFSR